MAAVQPFRHADAPGQPALIALLRLAALECRAAPRLPWQACALIDPAAGAADHAAALARILQTGLTRRATLWRPGDPDRSFDEAWLLALAAALRRGDRASVRFLSERRIQAAAMPILHLLLRALGDRLDIP